METIQPIVYKPIGVIRSPFSTLEGMPIQPSAARGIKGTVVLNEEYVEGLSDLEGFSHAYLLYHFHLSKAFKLRVVPFLDDQQRGLFSTRAPNRPNPIGLSVVRLNRIESNRIDIENVDVLDGTPLLDIKPYVAEMAGVRDYRIGWLTDRREEMQSKRSDRRFREPPE
jgi:tRNA-Thr(GGU) m(6)t(6)A37 methyltransferase TsaA